MCYAIPGKIKEIQDKTVIVDYYGETKKAFNEFKELSIGDYVYAQGGYVVEKIAAPEAEAILETWKDLFFELKILDDKLAEKQVINEKEINKEELIRLFSEKNTDQLYKTANYLRHKYLGNSCCVHGIIEISNICQRNCEYCGISINNKNLRKYRMSKAEILQSVEEAVNKYGFKALVLQSGENCGYSIEELADIIKTIRDKYPVLLFISFGEIGKAGLKKLFEAGARGLLLRFETSNPVLYEKLHPGYKLEPRLEQIRYAYELGYLIVTGGLIGLPGQTAEDIINDLYLAKELHAEMFSFGPLVDISAPNPQPLSPQSGARGELVIKVLALARLVDPENAKILVTTGLETISPDARRKGLMAGANSVMLNVTPLKYRQLYNIYPNRAHEKEEIAAQIEETLSLLKSLGRAPTDLGI